MRIGHVNVGQTKQQKRLISDFRSVLGLGCHYLPFIMSGVTWDTSTADLTLIQQNNMHNVNRLAKEQLILL